eukprot:4010186-Amphidinium_carterae.1
MFDIFDADHDHFLTLEEDGVLANLDKKMMLACDIEFDVDSLKEYQLCPHGDKVSVVEMMECPALKHAHTHISMHIFCPSERISEPARHFLCNKELSQCTRAGRLDCVQLSQVWGCF